MKILVIGYGLIASSIVHKLEKDGHSVQVFSRSAHKEIQSQQVLGDIFDFDRFLNVLQWKPQIVIHTAWITTPGTYRDHPLNYKYAEFTKNLAGFIAHSDVEHLIVLGTCAEYGHQIEPCQAGKTHQSPSTLYAQQKVEAHKSVKKILQGSEVRFTWARIFYPYGPKQDSRRLIPKLIQAIASGDKICLQDTSSVYDWISTRDIAEAINWIIQHELPSEIDIGTSVGFTNLQVLEILEDLLLTGKKPILHGEHNFGLNEMFTVSADSALLSSGWRPKDTLQSGLQWVITA